MENGWKSGASNYKVTMFWASTEFGGACIEQGFEASQHGRK